MSRSGDHRRFDIAIAGLTAMGLCGALCSDGSAQVVFNDVGGFQGIGSYWMAPGPTGGLAAADYDADGDIDLFVPTGAGATDQLYRNLGDGSFEEIAGSVGLASTDNHRVALWFDYDGDRRLDLVIGGDCLVDTGMSAAPCADPANLRLFRQLPDGQFTDVTIAAGMNATWGGTEQVHRSGFAAGDLNNDGWLDLVISGWPDIAYVYMNNGDGTFSLGTPLGSAQRLYHQPVLFDANNDGWLDVYLTVDGLVANRLWINQQDGTFLDRALIAGVNHAHTDMGVALGDYDNDGDFDFFVTNISPPTGPPNNVFYRNDTVGSTLSFTEISASLGVADTDWGWGTTFLDVDNDGDLDMAVTNGRYTLSGEYEFDPSRFFRNNGDSPVTFTDVSDDVGFNDTYVAACLIAADFDRDGDLDMAQNCANGGPLRLLYNEPGAAAALNHYAVIRTRMNGTNHFAIGAVVYATVGPTTMMRLITAGISQDGQEPAEAFFGLGSATRIDTLRIRWPDSTETTMTDVDVDREWTIYPCPGDVNDDRSLDVLDVDGFVRCMIDEPLGGDLCFVGDLTGDGRTNAGDIPLFLNLLLGTVTCPPAP